jgi:hypothetical protein
MEMQFLEVQLHMIRESGPAHHIREVGVRLAALHQRLDVLERQLRQRAQFEGEDAKAAISEVARRLSSPDRARRYRGPERRRRARRLNAEASSAAEEAPTL